LPSLLRQGASNLVAGFLGTARVEIPKPTVAATPPATTTAPVAAASDDLTLRDVIVIVGRVAIAAGIGVIALGALSFCGGYGGVLLGTFIASEKSEGDLLFAAVPVAGPIINLARNGVEQYDVFTAAALIISTLFQSAGIAVLFAGGICGGAGGFLVGFEETVSGAVDDGMPAKEPASAATRGSVDGAMAMVF
jgi:hypothetical protein